MAFFKDNFLSFLPNLYQFVLGMDWRVEKGFGFPSMGLGVGAESLEVALRLQPIVTLFVTSRYFKPAQKDMLKRGCTFPEGVGERHGFTVLINLNKFRRSGSKLMIYCR